MQKEIEALNVQAAFIGALLFSISLNLYALLIYKDILLNKSSAKKDVSYVQNIALLSAKISLVVTIYFFILAYDTYKNNESQANYNYYMASTLSLLAQSIRTSTLIKYPNDTTGVEDII